jgi:hypothetical protein
MFADNFPSANLTIPCQGSNDDTTLKAQLANLVVEQLNNENKQSCCNVLDKIKNSDYETFIEIVKLSDGQMGCSGENLSNEFESKYVNLSALPVQTPMQRPTFLADQVGMMPFCETATKLSLSSISASQPAKCTHFKPVVTAKGICYSYNSLSMPELFKPNRCINYFF